MKKNKKTGIIAGLIVGGAVGSVLSLFFAPDKGSKTRKKVMKKSQKLYDDNINKAQNLWKKK